MPWHRSRAREAETVRLRGFGRDLSMEMGAGKKSRSSSDTATAGKRSSMRSNSSGTTAAAAVERKEIERKRRQQMKSLCAKLASLIPKEDYSRVSVVATTDDRLMTSF